jgi:septal ring factor EnvC (AmiA/AmiB activator)
MTYERELQFQTHRHQALTTELGMLRAELDIHRKKIPQLQHALEEAEARETSRDERLLLASMFIVQGGWLVRMFMSRSGG